MKIKAILALLITATSTGFFVSTANPFIAQNNVQWTTLGSGENDSMPIGNGDLAANVWTEPNGNIVLLLSKADAWTDLGKLVKLGRIRVSLTPNPFSGGAGFSQTLRLDRGLIEIKQSNNVLQIWVDANHPVLRVEAQLAQAATLRATAEIWRTNASPYHQSSPDRGGFFEFGDHQLPVGFEPDVVLPPAPTRVSWAHYNRTSIYPTILEQQHLQSLKDKYPDPLLRRCFGAALTGLGLESVGDRTVQSKSPGKNLRLDIYALTETDIDSAAAWQAKLNALITKVERIKIRSARMAHEKWWQEFWGRSWIHLDGDENARRVSQGYALQRWMMACSSRGAQPVKFNGGLFTVGKDLSGNKDSTEGEHNPDFRKWGNCYWHQNVRLLYWPLIAAGDHDLLKPWYEMYLQALPLAKDRTRLYYNHAGAAFIETIHFWGLPNMSDFGWNNPTNTMRSEWVKFHTQSSIEMVAQMLDSYDVTQEKNFARQVAEFATEVVTYYNEHWPRNSEGKIRIGPTQSLETYQSNAINPTPDIAGLRAIIPRLLDLPKDCVRPEQRELWNQVMRALPEIPLGKSANGKIPRVGDQHRDATAIILPAEEYGKTINFENPELYVAFPYRLYGIGKPGLQLARDTYAARLHPQNTCWGQDGPQAAVLGLTDEAQKAVTKAFTAYGEQRFKWFWKSHNDWIPDLDNGGTAMLTLQLMLLQCDQRRIQLLPAWPTNWAANFKLHAPYKTVVTGQVKDGKIVDLQITPNSRRAEAIIVSPNK